MTSSSVKALPNDSIGTLWGTFPNPTAGAAPTDPVGLSGRARSGKAASMALRRCLKASYSESLMMGVSFW
jgi:hypothetical protein